MTLSKKCKSDTAPEMLQSQIKTLKSVVLPDAATANSMMSSTSTDVTRPTKRPRTESTRRKKLRIVHLANLHLQDTTLHPIVKSSKCNLVPLSFDADYRKSPVLVQLSGGGVIPLAFGIEDKDVEGRRKVQFAFQVDSLEDHGHLERLRDELGSLAVTHWTSWFPDTKKPSEEVILNFCNNLVSDRKKKKNSDDTWSGVSKAAIDPTDCASGRCKIVEQATGEDVPFEELPGMQWHTIILELRYVYIQATKSYGITKKLRYLSCTRSDEEGDIVPL